ncbi:MAG: nickel-dependent lactate racemase [Acidimicrobiia bacterium]|nr:nickel-dependent lactate racemase [Acidimicrobiia bacterium]
MKIKLAYGRSGLEAIFPDTHVDVIEPRFVDGLPDEAAALRQALRQPIGARPLRELAQAGDTVAVIFSDRTRPMPSDRVLPVVLSELENVLPHDVTLINAVGTHRHNTPEELEAMLGRRIVESFRIVQHRPKDRESMVRLGVSRFGNEVWVNRDFMQAKIKILTGFIEPHFFAGFSGGPKSVLLGVGAFESILRNHSAQMIDNPLSTWGVTAGNPIHEEMSEMAELVKPDFIVNVTLNKNREITGVFAGHWREAHVAGCDFARQCVMQAVERPYDLVVTTNSGFPLDLNLYQAVKGMSAAARIVKPGGAILTAAECSDGVPTHGNFRELLSKGQSPQDWLDIIHKAPQPIPDQWQVQILAKILQRSTGFFYSSLPEAEVRLARLRPVSDIAACVRELRAAHEAREVEPHRIAVLPEGPQTVPYLK